MGGRKTRRAGEGGGGDGRRGGQGAAHHRGDRIRSRGDGVAIVLDIASFVVETPRGGGGVGGEGDGSTERDVDVGGSVEERDKRGEGSNAPMRVDEG
jgi:hypothetical protein